MKKTYRLTESKHKPARLVDAIRSDIRKHLKRERQKELTKGVDFWDFDCKVGTTEQDARSVHVSALSDSLNPALADNWPTAYVEITTKAGRRTKMPKPLQTPSDDSK